MTSYAQVEDNLRELYRTYQPDSTAFQAILESLIECTPRNTEPAFYGVCIRKTDGTIFVKQTPDAKWQTVGNDSGGLDAIIPYSYNSLIADVLEFCYEKNASLLERKYLLKLISGLIVSPEYILDNKNEL